MQLKLKRTTNFTGRNGYFKMTAVDITSRWPDQIIVITPVTTKDQLANCHIDIPIENVDSFCTAMKELKQQILDNAGKNMNKKS